MHHLKNCRNAHHDCGFRFLQVLLHITKALTDSDSHTLVQPCKHVAGQLVSMVHRQNRQTYARSSDLYILGHIIYVSRNISVGQHNALGISSRSRGKQQCAHYIRIDFYIHELAASLQKRISSFFHDSFPAFYIRIDAYPIHSDT